MWLSRAREDSEIDALTLTFNRRGLDRILSAAVQDAATTGQSLVVGVIDVDHFKSINDLSGHAAGDRVLEDLSRAWQGVLRAGDSLGRLGGDEFVVVLPGCSWSDATAILERLRGAAMDAEVTCSMGAALRLSEDSASLLLSRADTALYEAKRLGRDRIAWAESAG
jgi:diguanylate cyclase (GGDEF)-like protein